MILVLAILIGCAVGWLMGGKLRNLEHLRLKYWPAILALFVVQVALRQFYSLTPWVRAPAIAYVWSFCVAGLTILAMTNRRTPGMTLVALGLFLNLIVVVINGGMPLSGSAAETLGATSSAIARSLDAGFYELVTDDTRLPLLGDIIPLPGLPGTRSVVSLGDLLMVIGAAVVLALGMRRTPAREGSAPLDGI